MQKIIFGLLLLLNVSAAYCQSKPNELDKSPLDIAYYPTNYPLLKMRGQAQGDPFARIIYSRPQKKGRELFGNEVKFDEVWRLGANESTELELFKSGMIGRKEDIERPL